MIVKKYEPTDEANFKTFVKSTWINPVPFDKDTISTNIANDPNNRNYIVYDDLGNAIGGGSWSPRDDTPFLNWIIMKDQTFALDTYMGILHKMVSDGLAEGFTKVIIPVNQQWLVSLVKTQFPTVEITEKGFIPNSKVAASWEIKADLQTVVDKLDQLARGG